MGRTVLMFGGSSDERFVSVASAQNISANYHFDDLWFLSPAGQVLRVTSEELSHHQNPFKNPFSPTSREASRSLQEAISSLKDEVVFLGLHGTEGEDGKIQELLEKSKIAFTGSGSKASRICFDKILAKKTLLPEKVTVAAQLILEGGDSFEKKLSDFFTLHRKIVVKPIANGSSVGLHIISDAASLMAAVSDIRKTGAGTFMAEKFVQGRELTIAVIDRNGKPMALPPSEVVLNAGHSFDYDGKYLGKGTTEITPAEITPAQREIAQDLALRAHKVLGCYGYSRTDAILSAEGITYLETNSLPGLTKASFVPQQLKCEGISMREFIEQQLELARQRR
jgi:D-alanine-D-alanine ligase